MNARAQDICDQFLRASY